MRAFVLLFVLAIPALGACTVASAKAAADIAKPVCTQYDEGNKPVARSNTDPAVSATSPSAPTSGNAATAQIRGGASGAIRPHGAPHWQTLLPGMFR